MNYEYLMRVNLQDKILYVVRRYNICHAKLCKRHLHRRELKISPIMYIVVQSIGSAGLTVVS